MRKEKTIKTLNAVLKELDMTSYRFAKELGFDRPQIIYDVLNPSRENVGISKNLATKIVQRFPQFNPSFLLTGEGSMLKSNHNSDNDQQAILIPLLPVSAEGGTLSGFGDSVMLKDCEKIISPIKEADMAITVSGESMAPEYPSGSQVVIKKINEKAFIDWGKAYIVDTCNGSIIKKLMPPDDGGKDRIKCVSINPEYPPFEVGFENIYAIYRILLCMSRK